jgi:MFS transporter, ACDE family, multidrug resistance protein
VHVPFAVGAVAVVAAVLVLSTGHRMLAVADSGLQDDDVAGEVADEFGGAPAAIDSEPRVEADARA